MISTNHQARLAREKKPFQWKLCGPEFILLSGITVLGTIAILGAM